MIGSGIDASEPLPVRILPELRSAHVQDYQDGPAVEVLYLDCKYDLDRSAIPDAFRRSTPTGAALRLFLSSARVLETPEPLWIRFLPTNLLLIAAWRLGGLVRRRPRSVVTYAIENNDLESLLFAGRTVPRAVRKVAEILLGASISLAFDRIAFGSAGARARYWSLPFVRRISSALFPHLPQARAENVREPVPLTAVFVGRLEKRKGIPTLLEAWRQVELELPGAHLRIIGSGPLAALVREWTQEDLVHRESLGAVPHREMTEVISDRAVLVAPSQRDGRWREQIGLPILEGLALGLTVVTTTETGNATWLRAHGHGVVAPGDSTRLTEALLAALISPIDRRRVLADLPSSRGRIDAAEWLLEDDRRLGEKQPDLHEKARDLHD